MRTTPAHDLPAGFVVLSNAAIHISKLRNHTTDVHRFLRLQPLIEELMLHEPDTEPWRGVTAGLSLSERRELVKTMYESSALDRALINDLNVEDPG